jgi:hypothetical protein
MTNMTNMKQEVRIDTDYRQEKNRLIRCIIVTQAQTSPPPSLYDKALIIQGFVVSGFWKNLPAHTSAHTLDEVLLSTSGSFSNGLSRAPTTLKIGKRQLP